MSSKFDKPYLEKNNFDNATVNELFNYARSFNLEGLRRHTLVKKIPLNVVNDNNENLIHTVIKTQVALGEDNEEKRLKIIKYLLSKGVNPDLPNNQGVTQLHLACEKQYLKIMEFLLECGANPNSKDNFGRTPSHYLLSGLIQDWDNKTNKPLISGTRNKNNSDLFKSKVEFKNYIYQQLEDNGFKTKIEEFINNISYHF